MTAQKHLAALQSWSSALDTFIQQYVTLSPSSSKLRQGATLLKVHSLVVSIVVGRPEDADQKFEDILALCDYLITTGGCFTCPLTTTPLNLNFSTDQGVIAPLFFTSLRAPDPAAKQRAIHLLARAPGREGMWDTEDAIRVAEAAQRDQGMGQGPITVPTTAPVQNDVRIWLDVAARLKSRMTWPVGERQPVEARPRPFEGCASPATFGGVLPTLVEGGARARSLPFEGEVRFGGDDGAQGGFVGASNSDVDGGLGSAGGVGDGGEGAGMQAQIGVQMGLQMGTQAEPPPPPPEDFTPQHAWLLRKRRGSEGLS